jgi:hypothetical protein
VHHAGICFPHVVYLQANDSISNSCIVSILLRLSMTMTPEHDGLGGVPREGIMSLTTHPPSLCSFGVPYEVCGFICTQV